MDDQELATNIFTGELLKRNGREERDKMREVRIYRAVAVLLG